MSQERVLNLIFTSDTHGHLFPVNYGNGDKKAGGLLTLAERIQKIPKKLRAINSCIFYRQ
ncbi:MAG: hypothetical protein LKH04_11140 [Lachnospiraceae bacterium]|jgi:2',3'-cyclic-nucleotide 2'-phosphodiesterase (5'-nucleotidase family)|nr:hypothetical protein [Lachnospiraceae bacterium]MCI1424818.1 hypothetical protein [Lachnospiraceae bacterium]